MGERLNFLMEASEMLKRRLREQHKSHAAQVRDVAENEERLCEQMAALERSIKLHEREFKTLKRQDGDGMLLKATRQQAAPEVDPNDHLLNVLAKLDKIAESGVAADAPLPKLSVAGGFGQKQEAAHLDLGSPPMCSVPIDSAR